MVWKKVIEALDSIIDDYERVNHLISFNQDDKIREKGLDSVGSVENVSLELGSGPGNYSRMIHERFNAELVCLDYSGKMHQAAMKRNNELGHHYIRGVFESLPIRTGSIGFVTSAYALRDSLDKESSYYEAHRVLRHHGKFLLVDIGKPNNLVLRTGMTLYMRVIVPLIGTIAGSGQPDNPWSMLYDTFTLLPKNNELARLVSSFFVSSQLDEYSFGGLVTVTAQKI